VFLYIWFEKPQPNLKMSEIYELPPEKKTKWKRMLIAGRLLNCVVFIGIIGYNLFIGGPNTIGWVIIGFAVLISIAYLAYQLPQVGLRANGYKLLISDDDITLRSFKRPDQIMTFDNMREVKDEYRRLRLIDRRDGYPNMFISTAFERYDEIRARLVNDGVAVSVV